MSGSNRSIVLSQVLTGALWQVRFSQQCYCWRFKPSGKWRHVFKRVYFDVSKNIISNIFRSVVKNSGSRSQRSLSKLQGVESLLEI